jgi:hypothetical protein
MRLSSDPRSFVGSEVTDRTQWEQLPLDLRNSVMVIGPEVEEPLEVDEHDSPFLWRRA